MSPSLHVDTDGGVDDAIAFVVLVRGGARIAAVSSVFGNTWVDQAASNANFVLRQSGCSVDVLVGAGASLAGFTPERNSRGHGQDGLNGQGGSFRRKFELLQRPHGVSRLAMAPRWGEQGVFLGPLTNLARAILEDPAAFRAWRPLVMAGAFEVEGRGLGGADFNSWSDPDALDRVLGNGLNPRLVPLDITAQVFIPRELFQAAETSAWPLLQRLWRASGPYMAFQRETWGGDGFRPHDAVAAAAALWPDLYAFEPACLRLDPERRGRLLRVAETPNAEICVRIDAQEVRRRMLAALFEGAPVTPP